MEKRLLAVILCMALLLGAAACSSNKKEDAENKQEQQEEQKKTEDQDVADAFTDTVGELSDNVTLKDQTTVISLREQYDAMTDEQKALVAPETVQKLDDAEARIKELKQKKKERAEKKKADKEAAEKVTGMIEGLPDKITLKSEGTVTQTRAAYDALSGRQKKLVDGSSLTKLEDAESRITKLKEKEEKKAEKKASKKSKKSSSKKASKQESKKKESDKFALAKKYIGKKATALTAAIGKPKSKKRNASCTDGEEYIYYYDGFYVGVFSRTPDDPLMVSTVVKKS